jgi:hypothetical protein
VLRKHVDFEDYDVFSLLIFILNITDVKPSRRIVWWALVFLHIMFLPFSSLLVPAEQGVSFSHPSPADLLWQVQ